MIAWLLGFGAGVVVWTLLEYFLHRFAFHQRVFGALVAKEHILHHAKVDYFAPPWIKVALAVPILGGIVALATLALGLSLGTSIPIGTLAGYAFYEVLHRRLHVAPPRGAYGRWARRHHLLHHFGRSDMNHGVTSPVWDIVFRTQAPRETVKVPKRFVQKFPWLLEEGSTSAIGEAFASDYRLV
jgi:sterol desaturase/sphingolipid hydroxylase (fatty acid hydroxylase superfamily)